MQHKGSSFVRKTEVGKFQWLALKNVRPPFVFNPLHFLYMSRIYQRHVATQTAFKYFFAMPPEAIYCAYHDSARGIQETQKLGMDDGNKLLLVHQWLWFQNMTHLHNNSEILTGCQNI